MNMTMENVFHHIPGLCTLSKSLLSLTFWSAWLAWVPSPLTIGIHYFLWCWTLLFFKKSFQGFFRCLFLLSNFGIEKSPCWIVITFLYAVSSFLLYQSQIFSLLWRCHSIEKRQQLRYLKLYNLYIIAFWASSKIKIIASQVHGFKRLNQRTLNIWNNSIVTTSMQ